MPTPDPVIRAMLAAALALVADTQSDDPEQPKRPVVVSARKPKPRR